MSEQTTSTTASTQEPKRGNLRKRVAGGVAGALLLGGGTAVVHEATNSGDSNMELGRKAPAEVLAHINSKERNDKIDGTVQELSQRVVKDVNSHRNDPGRFTFIPKEGSKDRGVVLDTVKFDKDTRDVTDNETYTFAVGVKIGANGEYVVDSANPGVSGEHHLVGNSPDYTFATGASYTRPGDGPWEAETHNRAYFQGEPDLAQSTGYKSGNNALHPDPTMKTIEAGTTTQLVAWENRVQDDLTRLMSAAHIGS